MVMTNEEQYATDMMWWQKVRNSAHNLMCDFGNQLSLTLAARQVRGGWCAQRMPQFTRRSAESRLPSRLS